MQQYLFLVETIFISSSMLVILFVDCSWRLSPFFIILISEGGVGEVFDTTKNLWSFRGKPSYSQGDLFFRPLLHLGESVCGFPVCKCVRQRGSRRGYQRTFSSAKIAVSSWIWMSGHADTWMTPQEQYGDMLCFILLFYYICKKGSCLLQLY